MLTGGAGPVLIDCGSSEGYPDLRRNLAALGIAPGDIRRVLATHGHWDHLSGFASLRADHGGMLELYIHEADRAQVEQGDPERTAAFLYGKPFPPLPVAGLLQDGETVRAGAFALTVLHTPGHSPGSVSFLLDTNAGRVLIAGDTLWGGYHPRVGSDLEAWSQSLDKLLGHDFDLLTFGHLPPTLVYDAKTKVAEARKQLGVYFNPWFKPFCETFRY
nr:MBL fold metallo-hydrolase [Paenibacillus sp. VKM B-2647]